MITIVGAYVGPGVCTAFPPPTLSFPRAPNCPRLAVKRRRPVGRVARTLDVSCPHFRDYRHFPQTLNASTNAYADATANLSATIRAHVGAHVGVPVPAAKIVLMADTNTESPEAAAATAGVITEPMPTSGEG